MLKSKLRVLVTHQLQYLPHVDLILVMSEGKIQQQGTFSQLQQNGLDFARLLSQGDVESEEQKQQHQEDTEWSESAAKTIPNHTEETQIAQDQESEEEWTRERWAKGRLIDNEERYTGEVKTSVCTKYFLSTGGACFLLTLFIVSILQLCSSHVSGLWLAWWANDIEQNSSNGSDLSKPYNNSAQALESGVDTAAPPSPPVHSTAYYLSIYLAIALTGAMASFVRQLMWNFGALRAAQNMHNKLLSVILAAPISFFHKTPVGRITNRFSRDLEAVDQKISDLLSDITFSLFSTVASVIVVCYSAPWLALVCLMLCKSPCCYCFWPRYFSLTG